MCAPFPVFLAGQWVSFSDAEVGSATFRAQRMQPCSCHPELGLPQGDGPANRFGGKWRQSEFQMPTGSPMAGYVKGEFEARPYTQFVEGGAQVVLHYLFAGAEHAGDVAVGETLPNQGRDLNFFRG